MSDTDATRYDYDDATDELTLADVDVGDRLAPELVNPQSGGDTDDASRYYQDVPDGARFPFQTFLAVTNRTSDHLNYALVFDPATRRMALLSAHQRSEAWNQRERDWKVRDVGHRHEVTDVRGVEAPDHVDDQANESPERWAAEWLDIWLGGARRGDVRAHEVETFEVTGGDANGFIELYEPYDGYRAKVTFRLVDEASD
jgi:hypothetical protein